MTKNKNKPRKNPFDPDGSYTGKRTPSANCEEDLAPVQDADDL